MRISWNQCRTKKAQILSCTSVLSSLGLPRAVSCVHVRSYSLSLRTRLPPVRVRLIGICIPRALPLLRLTSILFAGRFGVFLPCQVFLELWESLERLTTLPTFQIFFQKRFVLALLQCHYLGTNNGSIPPEPDSGTAQKRGLVTSLSNETSSPSNQDSTSST